jgi:hypothetical protein
MFTGDMMELGGDWQEKFGRRTARPVLRRIAEKDAQIQSVAAKAPIDNARQCSRRGLQHLIRGSFCEKRRDQKACHDIAGAMWNALSS